MSAVSRARSSGQHHSAAKVGARRARPGRGLLATGVVERDRQMALEAALQVVGGLAVAGQVDARGHGESSSERVAGSPVRALGGQSAGRVSSPAPRPGLGRRLALRDTGTSTARRRSRLRAAAPRTRPSRWPSGRRQLRPERPRGVHGGARERPAEQHVDRDRQSDRQSGDDAELVARVDGRAEDDEAPGRR